VEGGGGKSDYKRDPSCCVKNGLKKLGFKNDKRVHWVGELVAPVSKKKQTSQTKIPSEESQRGPGRNLPLVPLSSRLKEY